MPNKKIKDVMSAHDDKVKDDVFNDVRDKNLGNNNKSLGDVDAEGLPDVSEALIFLGMEEGWNDRRSRLEVVPFVVSRENMFNFLFVKMTCLEEKKLPPCELNRRTLTQSLSLFFLFWNEFEEFHLEVMEGRKRHEQTRNWQDLKITKQ